MSRGETLASMFQSVSCERTSIAIPFYTVSGLRVIPEHTSHESYALRRITPFS